MPICLKLLLTVIVCLAAFLIPPVGVSATYDPLSVANNRVGVHILDPQEIHAAAKLVNSSGGEWGYVTIPIRSDDRDRAKWELFFATCLRQRVIPIIRLSTYMQNDMWAAPNAYDLIDFANFLNEMPWPIKNRYIVVFNEPNHSKEWGGTVNPAEYAALLVQARQIFKSRSNDFFIISAGLDMSAPQNRTSFDALRFYTEMTRRVPGWINSIDGLGIHAYPNPSFTAPANSKTRFGPSSFTHEIDHLRKLGLSQAASLPIFITETGSLSSQPFFSQAFNQVWLQPQIVAITPFLLFANSPDFSGFSLLDPHHRPTAKYLELLSIPKIKGSPLLATPAPPPSPSPTSSSSLTSSPPSGLLGRLLQLFAPPPPSALKIGQNIINVEIANSDSEIRRGLSGRSGLPPNTGMLFVFPSPSRSPFWMKDMQFALDIIWISQNQVVGVSENLPPPHQTDGVPVIVSPPQIVDQVLEVPAGFVKQRNVSPGDPVSLI